MVTDFKKRMEKIWKFSKSLLNARDEYINTATGDLGFCKYDCSRELDHNINQLRLFSRIENIISGRKPIGNVAIMLPYDGSAWLSVAILSAWIGGNRVRIKFSSKGSEISHLTERLYKPIFGDEIQFSYESGKKFLSDSLQDDFTDAVIVFGSDKNILPVKEKVMESGKKLVFEGPGNDPFVVFNDAPLDDCMSDLVQSKYGYSGQTCTAPERILVQNGIYRAFIHEFIERTEEIAHQKNPGKLRIVPIASSIALENIKNVISDAKNKGGKIVFGGKINESMVSPTIIIDVQRDMIGMQDEIFGPVSMIMPFEDTNDAYNIAADNKYGLRASIWGGKQAWNLSERLKGKNYAYEVEDFVFGKFGTTSYNKPRKESWRGALVTRPIGGYGYSGWIWETVNDKFIMKQGPKLLSIETTIA